ncbi:MAG: hypothetical protein AAGK14_12425 [Verrucomicrobiota bacterium]
MKTQTRCYSRRLAAVLGVGAAGLLAGCTAGGGQGGEYGGVYYQDYSGPYGIPGAPVMTSEQVGTGIGPWGGIYNYEEINYGNPSS